MSFTPESIRRFDAMWETLHDESPGGLAFQHVRVSNEVDFGAFIAYARNETHDGISATYRVISCMALEAAVTISEGQVIKSPRDKDVTDILDTIEELLGEGLDQEV